MGVLLDIEGFLLGWLNIIPKFMYFLCVTLMSLIDAMQYVVRKLAGLDVYYIDGVAQSGDIAYGFIRSIFDTETKYPAIKNAFWALVIFAFILLVIATIIAVVRQEYAGSDNSKAKITGQFFKSIFLFLIVPVSCIFGLLLLEVVFKGIDSITAGQNGKQFTYIEKVDDKLKSETTTNGYQTYSFYDIFGAKSPSATTTFSGMMFKTAAYTANRVRIDKQYDGQNYSELLYQDSISNFGLFASSTKEEIATIVDEAFANCLQLKQEQEIHLGPLKKEMKSTPVWKIRDGKKVSSFSKYNVALVSVYYDLWQFNFLIGFAMFIICIKVFANIAIGLMRRIIEMVALFIVSPPLVAIMPLDGGKAFGKWRESFVSKALSALAAVVGMNVLLMILPYFLDIDLFNIPLLDIIFNSLFVIVGLTMVEGFIGLVSKMIGAEDANKSGSDSIGKVGATLSKATTMTGAVAGVAVAMNPAMIARRGVKAMANKGFKPAQALMKPENAIKQWLGKGKHWINDKFANNAADKQEAERKAEEAFNNGEADVEFEKKIDADENYKKEMDTAYQSYVSHGGHDTQEDWAKKNSKAKAIRDKYVQTHSNGMGKSAYLQSTKAQWIANKTRQTLEERTAQGGRIAMGRLGKAAKFVGMNNLGTFAGLGMDEFKGSIVRDGKGALNSMIMAFKGRTSKAIEEAALYKKLSKEEALKYSIQQKERENLNKGNK